MQWYGRGRRSLLLTKVWRLCSGYGTVPASRPPIVTIMGHVDHGKTTLLDFLRKSSIAAGEAGRITQHMGAFTVQVKDDQKVTFLDTPGHAAFSKMRDLGSRVTDIVLLVVSGEDGVMPQTKESIQLASRYGVPLVVAINKMDLVDEPKRAAVVRELGQAGVLVEELGGGVQCVGISALKGTHVETLLEALLAEAAVMDTEPADWSDSSSPGKGAKPATEPGAGCRSMAVLLEVSKQTGRGWVTTVLLRRGALQLGQWYVGLQSGALLRVRSFFSSEGRPVLRGGGGDSKSWDRVGEPVQVAGWSDGPQAGEPVVGPFPDERGCLAFLAAVRPQASAEGALSSASAFDQATPRAPEEDEEAGRRRRPARVRPPAQRVVAAIDGTAGQTGRLYVALLADVQGSLDALETLVHQLARSSEKVQLEILFRSVGATLTADQLQSLALHPGAALLAFQVRLDEATKAQLSGCAERAKDILGGSAVPSHAGGTRLAEENVVYHVVDRVKEWMTAQLPLVPQETIRGEAEVKEVFPMTVSKLLVAGCQVLSGTVRRGPATESQFLRLVPAVHTSGQTQSAESAVQRVIIKEMRHLKKEIAVATKGMECGLLLAEAATGRPILQLQQGDLLQAVQVSMVPDTPDWDSASASSS